MISTQDLSRLPDIPTLKSLSQSLAMLDAILCPEWEYRYYSFNSRWSEGEEMASMRNGSGDEYFLLFTAAGAIMKGFAHESVMSPYQVEPPQIWPGMFDGVPEVFASFLSEPAFSMEDTTFCLWRLAADTQWRHGPITFSPEAEDPDGSADLMALLHGDPASYQAWAEEPYGQNVPLDAVARLYQHEPLTESLVKSLNAEMSLQALQEDTAEIGYFSLEQ